MSHGPGASTAFSLALILPAIPAIIGFHLFLNPQGIPVAAILAVLSAALLWAYRGKYAGMFGR